MIREFIIPLHGIKYNRLKITSLPEDTFCRIKLLEKGLLYEVKYVGEEKDEDTEIEKRIEYDQITNVVKTHITRVDFFWVQEKEAWCSELELAGATTLSVYFPNANTKEGIDFYKALVNWLYS
jgi:hypothetical protein